MDNAEIFEQLEEVQAALCKARMLLRKLDGMGRYVTQLNFLSCELDEEISELLTLEE